MHNGCPHTSGYSTQCLQTPHTLSQGVSNKAIPVFARFSVNCHGVTTRLFHGYPPRGDVDYRDLGRLIADDQIGPTTNSHPVLARAPNLLCPRDKGTCGGEVVIITNRSPHTHRGQVRKTDHSADTAAIALPSTVVPSSLVTRSASVADSSGASPRLCRVTDTVTPAEPVRGTYTGLVKRT